MFDYSVLQVPEVSGVSPKPAYSRANTLAIVGYIALLAVVSATSIALGWNKAVNPDSASTGTHEVVVVQPGDTLWSIARGLCSDRADVRRLVYEIRQLNGLQSAVIHPGQHLIIPVD